MKDRLDALRSRLTDEVYKSACEVIDHLPEDYYFNIEEYSGMVLLGGKCFHKDLYHLQIVISSKGRISYDFSVKERHTFVTLDQLDKAIRSFVVGKSA